MKLSAALKIAFQITTMEAFLVAGKNDDTIQFVKNVNSYEL
ncbi:hypothetical protein BVRB_7g159020 [Beta vulgaris subsp. vulgaris]|nr:hypothetical protein BVRB_7g159020 [Beta vulgaris subsp. vulgaris]